MIERPEGDAWQRAFCVLASLCLLPGLLAAQTAQGESADAGQAPPAWLGDYLRQAELWTSGSGAADSDGPAHTAELRDLRRQAEKWRSRSQRPLEGNSLLLGLSPASLQEASRLAQDPAQLKKTLGQGVGFQLLLALAAQRDPSLKSARDAFQASVRGLDQADYLQELLVRYRAFTRELETTAGPALHRTGIKRHFPSPAALTLKNEIAQARIEAARLNYQAALRKTLNGAARTALQLQYVDSAEEVLSESRDLFRRMEQVALAQLRVNKASQSDALRSQALLDVLDSDLENLLEQRRSFQAQGNALLALPVSTEWKLKGSEDFADPQLSQEEAARHLQRNNQQMRGQKQRLRMLRAALRLADFNLRPLPSPGAGSLDLGRGAEAGPTRSAAAAFPNRPSLNRRAASYGVEAAFLEELRLNLKSEEEKLAALTASLQAEAEKARRQVSQARRTHFTYQQLVLPKILRAFNSMRGRYNTGDVAFIEYLDAGRAYLEASLEREKARRDHGLALTDLMDSLGLSAPRLLQAPAQPQPRDQRRHR